MNEPLLTPHHPFDPELARFVLYSRTQQAALSGHRDFLEARRLIAVMEESGKFVEMIRHFQGQEETPVSEPQGPAVREAVYQVLRAMQYEYCFSKITLLKILPHDLPAVKIEKEHLEILLFHLINYARQSLGERGGIITIEGLEKIYLSPENSSSHRFILRISHACLVGREELTGRFVDYMEPLQPLGDLPETGALYLARKIAEYNRGFFRMEIAGRVSSFHLEFPV